MPAAVVAVVAAVAAVVAAIVLVCVLPPITRNCWTSELPSRAKVGLKYDSLVFALTNAPGNGEGRRREKDITRWKINLCTHQHQLSLSLHMCVSLSFLEYVFSIFPCLCLLSLYICVFLSLFFSMSFPLFPCPCLSLSFLLYDFSLFSSLCLSLSFIIYVFRSISKYLLH